jgi:hypothetical protein
LLGDPPIENESSPPAEILSFTILGSGVATSIDSVVSTLGSISVSSVVTIPFARSGGGVTCLVMVFSFPSLSRAITATLPLASTVRVCWVL